MCYVQSKVHIVQGGVNSHIQSLSKTISIQVNNEDLIPDHSDELDEDMYAELKQNLKIKGLKVAHLNINGLFQKLSEVKFVFEETKLDILAVIETHLQYMKKLRMMTITLITIV